MQRRPIFWAPCGVYLGHCGSWFWGAELTATLPRCSVSLHALSETGSRVSVEDITAQETGIDKSYYRRPLMLSECMGTKASWTVVVSDPVFSGKVIYFIMFVQDGRTAVFATHTTSFLFISWRILTLY